MKNKSLKIIMTTSLVLYAVAMIVIATLPSLGGFESLGDADKIIHAVEFFIFTILLLSTLALDEVKDFYVISIIIVLLVVLISEIVQIPIIGRTFSIKDMIADLAGVALGYIVFAGVRAEWKYLKRLWSG